MSNLTQLVAALHKLCAAPGILKVLRHLCMMLKWATLLAAIMLLWRIIPLLAGLMS